MRNILMAFLIASVLLLPSCSKDFIELTPTMDRQEANSYKTEGDAFVALAAVYNALNVQPWMFVPMMSDVRSDDIFTGGDASGSDMIQYQEQERFAMTSENGAANALWNKTYSGIYRANLFLAKAEEITWTTAGLKDRMIAEARFLRGYFYWDLARHYGWVPIVTKLVKDINDIENLKSIPQSTPQEVYNQVFADISAAISVLPATVIPSQIGRVTKYAAQALLARIYLYYTGVKTSIPDLGLTGNLGDLNATSVSTMLTGIINSNSYSLLLKYGDAFSQEKGNHSQNNAEDIFSFQYDSIAASNDWGGWGVAGNFSVVMQGPRDPKGDALMTPGWSFGVLTFDLINEFEAGDPRKTATVYDASVSLTSYTRGYCNTGYFNKKFAPYLSSRGSKGEPVHNFGVNYPDIRYSDVLLMAAELNLNTNSALALEYFNKVRTRALGNAAALTTLTLDNIKHERRVEFAGEGHRYWDLMRWGLAYASTRIAASWLGAPTGNPMINVGDFTPRPFTANSMGMFPIPAAEIRNTNGNLKQFIPAYK